MSDEKEKTDLSMLKINRRDDSYSYNEKKKRSNLIKIIVPILLLIVIFIIFKTGIFSSSRKVEISTVSSFYPYQAKTVLNASGYVVAQRQAAVASKGTGRLVYLAVEEGSQVKKGDIIARLENDDMSASLARAKENFMVSSSNINQAKAELEDARADYERKKKLVSDGTISKSIFDAAQARYKTASSVLVSAEFSVKAAKAAKDEASVQFENTFIKAPFDGTVLTKNADVGEVVAPFGSYVNAKAAVITMADMNSLLVEADVSETNVKMIRVNQPCVISLDAYPEIKYRAMVHMIVPTADRAKASILTKIKFLDFDKRILPEMSAKVSFLSDEVTDNMVKTPKLAVNSEAVFSIANGKAVFILKKNKAVQKTIKTGEQFGDQTEILEGLSEGDKVVLKPKEGLKSGMKIEILEK
ncbi:MAG: hypothetical protein A3C43_02695 [Candidatus Schekmanbacteria bacterium RIFCSPHIGHO2_02_FULL_38_11]|nr:MAG: hypothetical protein A3C43_02695 [Candidatus Schekmanbacteria bacterium RIFCSPHIGHO2_02_FULL_38_11]